jgi:hypothetical protein
VPAGGSDRVPASPHNSHNTRTALLAGGSDRAAAGRTRIRHGGETTRNWSFRRHGGVLA